MAKLKLIVCGDPYYNDKQALYACLDNIVSKYEKAEIITTMDTGTAALAGEYAADHHIVLTAFPTDWRTHGKTAVPIRNQLMIRYALSGTTAEARAGLLLFVDSTVPLSQEICNLIQQAQAANLAPKFLRY